MEASGKKLGKKARERERRRKLDEEAEREKLSRPKEETPEYPSLANLSLAGPPSAREDGDDDEEDDEKEITAQLGNIRNPNEEPAQQQSEREDGWTPVRKRPTAEERQREEEAAAQAVFEKYARERARREEEAAREQAQQDAEAERQRQAQRDAMYPPLPAASPRTRPRAANSPPSPLQIPMSGQDSPAAKPARLEEKDHWTGWASIDDDIPRYFQSMLAQEGIKDPPAMFFVDGASCFFESDWGTWDKDENNNPLFDNTSLPRRAGPVIIVLKQNFFDGAAAREWSDHPGVKEHYTHVWTILKRLTHEVGSREKVYPVWFLTINLVKPTNPGEFHVVYRRGADGRRGQICRMAEGRDNTVVDGEYGKERHLHCEYDDVAVTLLYKWFLERRTSRDYVNRRISRDPGVLKSPSEIDYMREFMLELGTAVKFTTWRLGPV